MLGGMTHSDDWFPDRETGILGHGHDSLVIDHVKHSSGVNYVLDTPVEQVVAIVAQATLWALEVRADEYFAAHPDQHTAVTAFLHACAVPKELYEDPQ
jgi:hypothetical protein